jgi:hypothetical protein
MDGHEGAKFGRLSRERYSREEMAPESGYLSCKATVSRILDGGNQAKPLQELQTGKHDGKLYSRIVEGLDRGRSMGLGPIYYNYLIRGAR